MERTLFSQEHDLFRSQFRKWMDKEVLPHHESWEEAGQVPKEVWRRGGELGFLCPQLPEAYGGLGTDFRYNTIICEEVARAGASGLAFSLHSDIIAPYIEAYGSEAQKKHWLPKAVSGEAILAIAMTEPNTGSDLAAIKTTAIRDGDEYIINGSKTFISNGQICDMVIVAAKTDPTQTHAGVSLLIVECDRPGFTRGKRLKKIGMHAQDTSEMHFEDCRVPVTNLLGDEGAGFFYLMQKLQQERLVVAIGAVAGAEAALAGTVTYCQERKAFGKPIGKFQNTQFKLAEMATEVEIGRHFVDRLVHDHCEGKDVLKETCMAKWWTSDMLQRVVDQCLQLHGGYGYMLEYPIAKAYLDSRVQSIYAGTNEIMKVIIAKQMGL
jgi:acyl-CoA dehydrogenase